MFSGFREHSWNTYYPGSRSPASLDKATIVVGYFAFVLLLAIILVLVGARGRERWTSLLRFLQSFYTGLVILVCGTGQYWQVAYVRTRSVYVTSVDYVTMDIGVRIGMKSMNITLNGQTNATGIMGNIFYNERFYFCGAEEMEEKMVESKRRGLPEPILYTLEYFAVDQGGLRWRRAIRVAGHFTNIVLWSALVAWAAANILLSYAIFHGAAIQCCSGILSLVACALYATLQPERPLLVPFEDVSMTLRYGWMFWLCIGSGLLTTISGGVIFTVHYFRPSITNKLFFYDATLTNINGIGSEHDSSSSIGDTKADRLDFDTPFSFRRKMIRRNRAAVETFINRGYQGNDVHVKLGEKPLPLSRDSSDSRVSEVISFNERPIINPDTETLTTAMIHPGISPTAAMNESDSERKIINEIESGSRQSKAEVAGDNDLPLFVFVNQSPLASLASNMFGNQSEFNEANSEAESTESGNSPQMAAVLRRSSQSVHTI